MHEDGASKTSDSGRTQSMFRRRRGPVFAVLLGVVAILLAAWLWSRPTRPASGGPARILPASVVVTVDRSVGHCPEARFAFDGRITAPRPGVTVTMEWLKPDGFKTSPLEVKLDPGVQTVNRRFEWAYDGNQAASGDVVLHVLTPVDITSEPLHIQYQCP